MLLPEHPSRHQRLRLLQAQQVPQPAHQHLDQQEDLLLVRRQGQQACQLAVQLAGLPLDPQVGLQADLQADRHQDLLAGQHRGHLLVQPLGRPQDQLVNQL